MFGQQGLPKLVAKKTKIDRLLIQKEEQNINIQCPLGLILRRKKKDHKVVGMAEV